ncbi:MAG: FAD-dependent oxidoreductase [Pseudomonadota bacterium]
MRDEGIKTCAVVGAGAAGLTAARMLQARGVAVTVFDKGRKPGGRLATKSTAHGTFDHGVQYLAAEGASLRQSLLAPCSQGHAGTWAVSSTDDPLILVRYPLVGVPSNNQIAQCWATGLSVLPEHHVESIRRAAATWQLRLAGQEQWRDFDAVVVTVPQPQLQSLLPELALPESLHRIEYAPCWTLMWVPVETDLPELLPFSPAGHECIGWVAREDSKPGRSGPARYVVHATATWSQRHLEQPAESAAAALQTATAALLGISPQAHFTAAHRWRFARVRQSLQLPQLQLAPGLHYASDGCLGDSVEYAMTSGAAATRALLATRF